MILYYIILYSFPFFVYLAIIDGFGLLDIISSVLYILPKSSI